MEDRELARQLAIGRLVVGAGSVVAPRLVLRSWVGAAGADGGVKALGRAFGIRDAFLGLGTLQALDRDEHVKEWLVAGAVCDGTDAVATLLAARSIPKRHAALMLLTAGGATAIGAILASRWG